MGGSLNRRAPTTTNIFLKTQTLLTFDEMPSGFDCSQPSNEMRGSLNRRAPTTTNIFLKTQTLYTFNEMPPGLRL